MHEVLVNRLGGLKVGRKSLPRKSVARLTYRPDMTLDVYSGRKTITHNTHTHDKLTVLLLFTLGPANPGPRNRFAA